MCRNFEGSGIFAGCALAGCAGRTGQEKRPGNDLEHDHIKY